MSLNYSIDHPFIRKFPELNQVLGVTTFSSLLRITGKSEMPGVHNAYPETFEGLGPSTPIRESAFSGPASRLDEVLNLFVQ